MKDSGNLSHISTHKHGYKSALTPVSLYRTLGLPTDTQYLLLLGRPLSQTEGLSLILRPFVCVCVSVGVCVFVCVCARMLR